MSDEALKVGQELVALCQEGKNMEAVERLYADNVESIEAVPMQGKADETRFSHGKDAVRAKGEWWYANHELHSGEVRGPFPHGERFCVYFKYEVTPKATGEKMTIEETGLYTVENGKVVKEEFFYHF